MSKICTILVCAFMIVGGYPMDDSQLGSTLTHNLFFVLSARNLPSTDSHNGKIDAYAEVRYGAVPPDSGIIGSQLNLTGYTEKVENEQNPDWIRVFNIKYIRGSSQKLWIQVKDYDTLRRDDFVGSALWIDMDEYMSNGQHLSMPLIETSNASLRIHYTMPFHFSLALHEVPSLDWFGGLSDSFVKCYFRNGIEGKDTKFYQTEVVTNSNSVEWEDIIAFDNFIRGTNQYFSFKVRDHDKVDKDDHIGEALLELDSFVQNQQTVVLALSTTHNATLTIKWEGWVGSTELT